MNQGATTQRSPLLRLPAELRNSIYELGIGGREIRINSTGTRPVSLHYQPPLDHNTDLLGPCFDYLGPRVTLSLSTACRQLSTETVSIFYAMNTFQGYPHVVAKFVRQAGVNGHFVRTVRLYLDKYFYRRMNSRSRLLEPKRVASAMLRDLRELPRLERILVHLNASMLQRATEESILATFRDRWRKGREGRDVEFVLHFES